MVAGHDPIRIREICEACTIVEVAEAYVSRIADSDYTMNILPS